MTEAIVLVVVVVGICWAVATGWKEIAEEVAVTFVALLDDALRKVIIIVCNVIYFYVLIVWVLPFVFRSF